MGLGLPRINVGNQQANDARAALDRSHDHTATQADPIATELAAIDGLLAQMGEAPPSPTSVKISLELAEVERLIEEMRNNSDTDSVQDALQRSPPVLASRTDPNARCDGAGLSANGERMMRAAMNGGPPNETSPSDIPPPLDYAPASPIRSNYARGFFDRYLEAQARPWDSTQQQHLMHGHGRPHGLQQNTSVIRQSSSSRVVHVTPEMAERLKIAKCAIDLARALLCHGPANQVRNLQLNGFEADYRGTMARNDREQTRQLHPCFDTPMGATMLRADTSIRWEAGYCDEYAAVTMSILAQLPEMRDFAIDVIGNSDVKHTLVVIRSPNPQEDIVVDAWSVMPVPCLKTDAAQELGVMAERPGPDSRNTLNARKEAGEMWPRFDIHIDHDMQQRRALATPASSAGTGSQWNEAGPAAGSWHIYDAPFNGNPNVAYVKTEPDGTRSDQSAHSVFGFRFERWPSEFVQRQSSRPVPTLSSSSSGNAPQPTVPMVDEQSSAHPATANTASVPMDVDDDDALIRMLLEPLEPPRDAQP